MGNQQSNERQRNWKLYKITEVVISDNWIRLGLDDYVTYANGNYKWIYFEKGFFYRFTCLYQWGREGSYIAIDLEKTRCKGSQYDFDAEGGVMKFISEVTGGTSETAASLGSIGDMLEQRQNLIASIEQSRHANNHAWTKQTSWDMPPGWK